MGFPQILRQCDRLRGDAELLHRPGPAAAGGPHQECRRLRVLQHHPDTAAVQTDPPLLRPQDPAADLPSLRQGAHASRLLPCPWHRHIRQPRVLRRADTG